MALSELWKPIPSHLKATNVPTPTQTVPQCNLGTAINGTKSSIKPNILADAPTMVPAQFNTTNRSVRLSSSSHPSRTYPRRKDKMLPDDVRRQYRHSGMWHNSVDKARAALERESCINAIHFGEENCDLVQYEAECAALKARKRRNVRPLTALPLSRFWRESKGARYL